MRISNSQGFLASFICFFMENKYKDSVLNFFGALLLAIGFAAVANSLHLGKPMQVFWICYLGLILIGIGILLRSSFVVASQLNILVIPLIVWNIDFFHWVVFRKQLWGVTDYLFLDGAFDLGSFISLQHLFTILVGLYAIYLIGLKRRDAWKLSMIEVTLYYFASRLFTSPELNVNCVFEPCVEVYFGLSHGLTWFLGFFSLIIITSFVINRTFLENEKENYEAS